MDILGTLNGILNVVQSPIGYITSGLIMGTFATEIVKFIYHRISKVVKPGFVKLAIFAIKRVVPAEKDRELALALIEWAELTFPWLSGLGKKEIVVSHLRKYFDLDQKTAETLVQLVFDDWKEVKSQVKDGIKLS